MFGPSYGDGEIMTSDQFQSHYIEWRDRGKTATEAFRLVKAGYIPPTKSRVLAGVAASWGPGVDICKALDKVFQNQVKFEVEK